MSEISERKEAPRKRQKRQRRARGQLHLTQDARSGIYYIRGTVRGIRVRESTGTCDANVADALRVKKENELLQESVHGKKVTATLSECITHYLTVNGENGFTKSLIKINADIGDTRCKDVNTTLVHQYALREFPNFSGLSRNCRVVKPIITVMRCAAHAGMCELPVIQLFRGEHKKVTGPGDQWIEEFLERCDRPKWTAWVLLLTTTGCRGIDARRLRTENVNFEQMTAYLPKTKNGEARTLHLTRPLVELLKSFEHGRDGTLFGISNPIVANQEINKVCKRIGMPYVSNHRLGRHAIAERLLNRGWTLKQVAEAVGWKDIVTLHKRYGHLEKKPLDEKLREEAASVMRGSLRVVNGGKT